MAFEDLFSDFRRIEEGHERLRNEYDRLSGNILARLPKVGDRVIVAAGLLMRGHLWVRKVCTVLEVGQNSYRVRCDEKYDDWEEWIDPVLIIDILPKGELMRKE